MRTRKYRYFAGDFETTVYEGQTNTEVWASACVELNTEDTHVFHSIQEQFEYFKSLNSNLVVYYHNLKFDGSFWLSYLLTEAGFTQAYTATRKDINDIEWLPERDMPSNSFKYSISDRGQWYSITIKTRKHVIELRDSLKLIPFSLAEIGDSFKTKHRKLEMEYTGLRFAGCQITDSEREYIENDVLVLKEALEIMFEQGHDKLTIGSCCLSEYKNICKHSTRIPLTYEEMFPNLYEITLDKRKFGAENVGEYIRKSYKGGWCYLVKGKENRVYHRGTTADVNSLYPSVMSSESGNRYPVGAPHFWKGNTIDDKALGNDRFYFVRIKTRFYLKPGYLPFIQIKNSFNYPVNECLETSDVLGSDGKYHSTITGKDGETIDTRVELTLTMTDYELLKKHYELVDFEILDGVWFYAYTGIFDEYIEKYKKIKQESTGALRTLAKLFLNNLYGKMASSTDSSFKIAYVKTDGSIGFRPIVKHDKKPGYIPVGSAITSYARNFTIKAAQRNYHGVDEPGFIYADTDSIHCDLPQSDIVGITVHHSNFCCWKLEASWDEAIFTRQKTYIEHVTHEDLKPVEPYYNVKCAGMPNRCKELLVESFYGEADRAGYIDNKTKSFKEWKPDEKRFLFDEDGKHIVRRLTDFNRGLKIPGKLLPKRIPGGILLKDTYYEMR